MKRVMIVPYGTGIGDMVNMRPIATAIARHYRGHETAMLCPAHLAWLVPDGIVPIADSVFLRLWKRSGPDGALARISSRIPGRIIAPAMERISPVLADSLTRYLTLQGYDEVINLLHVFASLDLSSRWTTGPWNRDRRHVVDIMCDALVQRGISIPRAHRIPTLNVSAHRLTEKPHVVLQPEAGSNLKSPAASLWDSLTGGLTERGFRCFVLQPPGFTLPVSLLRNVAPKDLLDLPHLRDVAAVVGAADAVISPDTSILHLAAAAGSRFVGLFGPTDPAFLGPYDTSRCECVLTTASHEESCRSCWAAQLLPVTRCALRYDGGCMAGIEPQAVLSAFDRVMGGEPKQRNGSPRPIAPSRENVDLNNS